MAEKELRWIKLMGINDQLPREGKIVYTQVESRKIYICRWEGVLYAGDDQCPHAGGILSKGYCENKQIVCPLHRWKFDLESGKNTEGEGGYINTYPIKREENIYWLGLPQKKWWEF